MIQTVAVIGGSGFVGRATIEKLAQAGKQIIVLCRNSDRAKFLKPMGRIGQITIVAGNALDDAALEAVLAPADAVVNMVGILAESGAQKFGKVIGGVGILLFSVSFLTVPSSPSAASSALLVSILPSTILMFLGLYIALFSGDVPVRRFSPKLRPLGLLMFVVGFGLLTLGTWVLNDFNFLTFTN